MQDQELPQVEAQSDVVATSETQTEMQDIKPDAPPTPIELAPPNQATQVETPPVGTDTNREQGEDPGGVVFETDRTGQAEADGGTDVSGAGPSQTAMDVDGPGDTNVPQNEPEPQPPSSHQPPPQGSLQEPIQPPPENHQNNHPHASRGLTQESLHKPLPTPPVANPPQRKPSPAYHDNGGSTHDNTPLQSGAGLVGTIMNFPSYVSRSFQLQPSPNQHVLTVADYSNVCNSYEQVKGRYNHYKARYFEERDKVDALHRQLEDRKREIERISKIVVDYQAQNEEFRSQIFALGTGRGPLKDEEFYTSTFEELKCRIEKEIVKLSKPHANYVFQEKEQQELLQRMSEIGLWGQKCAEFLKTENYSLQRLYSQGQWRHPLLRHIVAWFLLERVFNPFSFGISHEFSEGLKCVERDVISRGNTPSNCRVNRVEKQFSNVLMVHQAIGRGAKQFSQESTVARRTDVMVELGDLLCKLLPRATHEAIGETVLKIVDKAIYLKTAMSEEQALYHCFWIDYGEEYKENFTEVANEDETGRVLLCTFPGLARTIKKDNEVSEVLIVKARAMLESAFEVEQ